MKNMIVIIWNHKFLQIMTEKFATMESVIFHYYNNFDIFFYKCGIIILCTYTTDNFYLDMKYKYVNVLNCMI